MPLDIKLTQDENGYFDIDFANGDIETTEALDTAIYLSIFSKARAPSYIIPEPFLKEGHFSNHFNYVKGREVGGLQWIYTTQESNSERNLEKFRTQIEKSLSWMKEDGIISNINVVASKQEDIINIDITLQRKDKANTEYYTAFIKTFT